MVETIGLAGDEGTALDHDRRLRHLRPGALVGRGGHLRPAGAARRGDPRRRSAARLLIAAGIAAGRRGRRGPRGCGSFPRSAASSRSAGAGRCRCRSRPGSTGSCSGSASPPSCSASASGRWPGSAWRSGDPAPASSIGAAFGSAGRSRSWWSRPPWTRAFGNRCIELMAERPAIYRLFRLGDAVTLGLVAVALASTASATAARTEVPHGADPSAAGKALAFQRADRAGVPAVRGPAHTTCPGATRRSAAVRGRDLRRRPDQDPEPLHAAADSLGAGARRGGDRDLARLARVPGDQAGALPAAGAADHRPRCTRATSRGSRRSRVQPSSAIRASTARSVFYTVSKRHRNSIKRDNLKSGKEGTVVRSRARPAAESLGTGQAPALRSREPRVGAAAGDPSAATATRRLMIKRLRPPGPATRSTRAAGGELSGRRRWPGGTPSSPCSGTVARRSSRPTAYRPRRRRVSPGYGGARTCGGMFPTPIAR